MLYVSRINDDHMGECGEGLLLRAAEIGELTEMIAFVTFWFSGKEKQIDIDLFYLVTNHQCVLQRANCNCEDCGESRYVRFFLCKC